MIEPGTVAVIFTSTRSSADESGYATMAARMESLASEHDGFVSVHSVRNPQARTGITVSYWRDDESARSWKLVQEHVLAQELGRATWYTDYSIVVASVIRAYGSDSPSSGIQARPQ